ncbi:MAG: hypothetical protein NTW25_07625 [Candidatus Kapabacteria bacterium]|nr:hypothetical protein [Candidatus Kapabacteria bacterium]
MKKIILSALLYVMLISVNCDNLVADCPPNYIQQIILYSIPGTNCVAKVEVCYQCTPTNSGNVNIGAIEIYDCDDRQNAWGVLNADNRSALIKYAILHINYGNCTPPPCDQGVKQFVVRSSACNYYQNVVVNGVKIVSKLIPCSSDGAYCEKTYNLCWDGTTMLVTLTGSYLIGIPNCSTILPEIGSYPYNWDQNWETYCFTAGCN